MVISEYIRWEAMSGLVQEGLLRRSGTGDCCPVRAAALEGSGSEHGPSYLIVPVRGLALPNERGANQFILVSSSPRIP